MKNKILTGLIATAILLLFMVDQAHAQSTDQAKETESHTTHQEQPILRGQIYLPLFAGSESQNAQTEPDNQVQSPEVTGAVIKGRPAKRNSLPFMAGVVVHLSDVKASLCGGTIVGAVFVLTAAHCVVGRNPASIRVFVGHDSPFINDRLREAASKVGTVYIHPNFNKQTLNNDLALLRVSTPLTLKKGKVETIALNKVPHFSKGTQATIAGWGASNYADAYPASLRRAQVPIASNKECLKAGSGAIKFIPKNMICGGKTAPRKPISCSGDSGGPLLVKKSHGKGWKQIGIISAGVDDCGKAKNSNSLEQYTRISKYHDWIQKTMLDDWLKEIIPPK